MTVARTYRISALASGFVRMWRGWQVVIPTVIANAILQGGLAVIPSSAGDATSLLLGLLSAVVFLIAYGLTLSCAVQVADATVGWTRAVARLRSRGLPFVLTTIGFGIVVLVGLAIFTIPGWLVLSIGVFVPTAAMAGPGNPVRRGLATIRRRPGRWLVTILITALIVLIGSYLMGITAFFIRGFAAATLVWLVGGLLIAWLTTAFALIYRDAWGPSTSSSASP